MRLFLQLNEMRRHRVGILTAIGIACLSWNLVACAVEGEINTAKNPLSQSTHLTRNHEDQLVLLEYKLITEDGHKMIQGLIVNGTKHNLSLVDIVFDLYNDHGSKLGEALVSDTGLESGGKWEFETSVRQHTGRAEPVQLKGYR